MDTLSRVLRDAADEAPTSLAQGGDDWVEASWRAGRRRRVARGVAAGAGLAAAAALVVSLVVSGVGGMPSASVPADGSSRSGREGATSYPQRIGHQWWVRDLPDIAGPLAGLVRTSAESGQTSPSSWQAITSSGTRYRLPTAQAASDDLQPAVSPDGWRVAYFQTGLDRWLVRDLRNGHVWLFSEVGGPGPFARAADDPRGPATYQTTPQSPAFFSRDGQLLAVPTLDGPVVLSTLGSPGRLVEGMAFPAGWTTDDRLLGNARTPLTGTEQPTPADTGVDLVEWDRRTGRTEPVARVGLPQPRDRTINSVEGQRWGSVRADGTLWVSYSVSVPEGSVTANQNLVGYALPSGEPVDLEGRPTGTPQPVVVDEGSEELHGPRSWHVRTPLAGRGGEVPFSVFSMNHPEDVLVAVDPSVGVIQMTWAQDAIDGSPRWSPLGTWSFLPLWWWKEIALAALAVWAARWWFLRRSEASADHLESRRLTA